MKAPISLTMPSDVPAMAVDVLNADFTVRAALAARPGEVLLIDNADDDSLLRFAVPGANSVLVGAGDIAGGHVEAEQLGFGRHTANLSLAAPDFEMFGSHSREAAEAFGGEAPPIATMPLLRPVELAVGGKRALLLTNGTPVVVEPSLADGVGAIEVTAKLDDGVSLILRIPSSTVRLTAWVYPDVAGRVPMIAVRIKTASPTADALANYLLRNDLDSAGQLSRLSSEAVLDISSSEVDVFEACAGAYVMLRRAQAGTLTPFAERLHKVRPTPDTAVILAACLVDAATAESDDATGTIVDLLNSAIDGGYPVYTVGLRILADTVHLLGEEGLRLNTKFLERSGTTYWRSPFDASWLVGADIESPWTRASLDIACDTMPSGWTSYLPA